MALGLVVFANIASLVGATSVEVPETDRLQAVSGFRPFQNPLDHELRVAVGVHRVRRVSGSDGNALGFAKDGSGRRKDEVLANRTRKTFRRHSKIKTINRGQP